MRGGMLPLMLRGLRLRLNEVVEVMPVKNI